ncbi:uncharacterized protein F4807DRAFT_21924 [Annulohypoxylon truncatum]|uniref:uncharacterized protein n=1 Tax=Annulohypoxylon truncatum TaxID=327061 RepID=UPI0020086E3A|nr:uncharacterized protein F4807DRAFT_21924 [Annulohypoxylon truncatum]KAI1215134.1 hypothetical protein F4807DRAFT_21924 [Annulohypoxylon truncatum]
MVRSYPRAAQLLIESSHPQSSYRSLRFLQPTTVTSGRDYLQRPPFIHGAEKFQGLHIPTTTVPPPGSGARPLDSRYPLCCVRRSDRVRDPTSEKTRFQFFPTCWLVTPASILERVGVKLPLSGLYLCLFDLAVAAYITFTWNNHTYIDVNYPLFSSLYLEGEIHFLFSLLHPSFLYSGLSRAVYDGTSREELILPSKVTLATNQHMYDPHSDRHRKI